MATIEIDVEEKVLREAATILDAVGMDVPTAVKVFLRRVIAERDLPWSTAAPQSTAPETSGHNPRHPRANQTITREMVDEVWQASLRHRREQIAIGRLADEVADTSGMNRGSAFIYLQVLSNLVKGEYNTRLLKFDDLEYLMGRIRTELGENAFSNSIQSLRESIPYWREKVAGRFADKVEAYCEAAS